MSRAREGLGASLGRIIDAAIAPFAPRTALRRLGERQALDHLRQYDAASLNRRTQGWRRPGTSANAEIRRGLPALRNGSRDLVRNNPTAAAAVQTLVAHIVGDGISLRAEHPDPKVKAAAQAAWDAWCDSPVDGRNDFYAVQGIAVRAMIEGGEALVVWAPDDTGPDGRVRVLEGDWLDSWRRVEKQGAGRTVDGIELDANGDRAAYWLFDNQPGDIGGFGGWGDSGWGNAGFTYGGRSTRFDAAHVDHLFREDRPGQMRGVPWLTPSMMTLRDDADLNDATLMKKKVEACVGLILTPPDGGGPTTPFDTGDTGLSVSSAPSKSPDTMRPGMIFRARPGETATTLSPTSSGDGVEFSKWNMMKCCATLAPYHFVTGDPSQSNYSAVRALSLPFWANLDGWQQHTVIPQICVAAWRRRMARLALGTGDKRFLEVRAIAAPPMRRQNDPIKDGAGELMEIRNGLQSMPHALTRRGLNPSAHLAEIAAFNAEADQLKLAFDTDPRRLTDAGMLQAAAGYLFGGQPNQGN